MAATSCLPSAAHCMGLGEAVSLPDTQPLACGLPHPAAHGVPAGATGSFREFRGDGRLRLAENSVGLSTARPSLPPPAPGASSACGALPESRRRASVPLWGVPPLEMKRILHTVVDERDVCGWLGARLASWEVWTEQPGSGGWGGAGPDILRTSLLPWSLRHTRPGARWVSFCCLF